MDKKLLLLVVAYHPVEEEVLRLKSCLNALPSHIAYAVAANDYKSGESVDLLEDNSEYFCAYTTMLVMEELSMLYFSNLI